MMKLIPVLILAAFGLVGFASSSKYGLYTGPKTECHDPSENETLLLDFLQSGLPYQNCARNSSNHVIVVGAGISGLVAAQLLKDEGHKVTILESSNRVGGRIQTYRNLDDNWQMEFGAMRIPKNHFLTRELVLRFGLDLAPFYNRPHAFFVDNKRLNQQDSSKEKLVLNVHSYMTSLFSLPDDVTAAHVRLSDSLQEPLQDMDRLPWKEFLAKYDRYSLKQWLYQHANVSQDSIGATGIYNNLESFINLGLVETLVDECVYGTTQNQFDYVVNGFDLIPKGFLPQLKNDIIYRAKVTEIKQSEDGATVKFSCSGNDCSEKSDVINGDYVIVSTTAPIALSINYDPPLSSSKRFALRNIHYTSATKVLLSFEIPFWEREHGQLKGGSTFTDLGVKQIYYPQKGQNERSNVHALVASYTWGGDADRFDGMSEEDIIGRCLTDISIIHNRDLKFIKKIFRKGIVKSWANDPHTIGAFAYLAPYQYVELSELLKQPEGLISFCGEYTTTPHGWINTAIKSGIRSALEIHFSSCSKP